MYEELERKLTSLPQQADVVLDTDCYNEVDDQFALSFLLANPRRVNLLAVTAAPFLNQNSVSPEDGMLKSLDELRRIIALCGRSELLSCTFEGSRDYLENEHTPRVSPAAQEIVRLANLHTPQKPLYVISIGCITNAASALLLDPGIRDKVVYVWLGGHALTWPDTAEFNMRQDIPAARAVFQSGCALALLPCMGVVSGFTITAPEIRHWLLDKNAVCDYLGGIVLDGMRSLGDAPWSRVLWDVCAAAWVMNDSGRFMDGQLRRMPLPNAQYQYSQTELTPHPIQYVWHIKRDALMGELIKSLQSFK